MKKLATTTITALAIAAALAVSASSASAAADTSSGFAAAANSVSGPWKAESHCIDRRNALLQEPGIIVTSSCYGSGTKWYFTYMRT